MHTPETKNQKPKTCLLRIGTRKSPLALRQVELTVAAMAAAFPEFASPDAVEIVPIVTSGDQFGEAKLADIGGKGLFTKEIDEALLTGRVDIAVHSAKDMQTVLPEGLVFVAALEREDARDVLVSHALNTLNTLPRGARVGTSSLRRALMLQHARPDLTIKPIRGNIQTRMRKIEQGEFDATILAYAGIKRMGIDPLPGTLLDFSEMLPAPAQGIIAIQCRVDDKKTQKLLAAINHQSSMEAAIIERRLLALLDGSCRTPIAAYTEIQNDKVHIRAMLGNEQTGQVAHTHAHIPLDQLDGALEEMAARLKDAHA